MKKTIARIIVGLALVGGAVAVAEAPLPTCFPCKAN